MPSTSRALYEREGWAFRSRTPWTTVPSYRLAQGKWIVTHLQHVGLVPRIVVDLSATQQIQWAKKQGGIERVSHLEKVLALSEIVEVLFFFFRQ